MTELALLMAWISTGSLIWCASLMTGWLDRAYTDIAYEPEGWIETVLVGGVSLAIIAMIWPAFLWLVAWRLR